MKELTVPNGKSGDWEVSEFTVSESEARMFNMRQSFKPGCGGRGIDPGKYKKLMRGQTIVMSNTPAELSDHQYFISMAEGDILISGLGLGVVVAELLKKQGVKSITVVEMSEDVMELVAPVFEGEERVQVIHGDALEWKPPQGVKYDYAWHDIWDDICADNLETMKKLHRKYGRKSKWQGSWCRALCEMQNRQEV